MIKKTDQELVTAALSDPDAFAQIIEKFEAKLARYIRRITNLPHAEQEDVLQEVFIKVYQNLNAYNPTFSLSAWIYRIARNHTISYFRSYKNFVINTDAEDAERILHNIESEINFVKELDRSDLGEKVQAAIKTLPQKYQEVIVLRYLEDQNYKQISDILKKPPGTVAILLSRAKKYLQNSLQDLIPQS